MQEDNRNRLKALFASVLPGALSVALRIPSTVEYVSEHRKDNASDVLKKTRLKKSINLFRDLAQEMKIKPRSVGLDALDINKGPSFSPGGKGKPGFVNYDGAIEGIMGHELGHAKIHELRPSDSSKILSFLRRHGNKAGFLGSTAAMFVEDDDKADALTLLSTGAYLPRLIEEGRASSLGGKAIYNIAKREGDSFLKRIMRSASAFKGMPSYLAAAAVPIGAHFSRKILREGKKDE